jgi:hypothetical protein
MKYRRISWNTLYKKENTAHCVINILLCKYRNAAAYLIAEYLPVEMQYY